MPAGDGTGPMGQGPRTGGGRGNCRTPQSAGCGRRFWGIGRAGNSKQGMECSYQGNKGQRGIRGVKDLNPSR
jgi:hypothetical protein